MPAKKACNVLPMYLAAIRKGGKVIAYKYQRRVPKRVYQMAQLAGDTQFPKTYDI